MEVIARRLTSFLRRSSSLALFSDGLLRLTCKAWDSYVVSSGILYLR